MKMLYLMGGVCLLITASVSVQAQNEQSVVKGFALDWSKINSLELVAKTEKKFINDAGQNELWRGETKIFYKDSKKAFYINESCDESRVPNQAIVSAFNGKDTIEMVWPHDKYARISKGDTDGGRLFFFENPVALLQLAAQKPSSDFRAYFAPSLSRLNHLIGDKKFVSHFIAQPVSGNLTFYENADTVDNKKSPTFQLTKYALNSSGEVSSLEVLGPMIKPVRANIVFSAPDIKDSVFNDARNFSYIASIQNIEGVVDFTYKVTIEKFVVNQPVDDSVFTPDPRKFSISTIMDAEGRKYEIPSQK